MKPCLLCRLRGQTWKGDAPDCGFTAQGRFTEENWNCATLNALRDLADDEDTGVAWRYDRAAGIIGVRDEFLIVLGWYKNRGRTECALVVDGPDVRPLTLDDAAHALRLLDGEPCPTRHNTGLIERAATPEEVDDGCELGVAYDPCPNDAHHNTHRGRV